MSNVLNAVLGMDGGTASRGLQEETGGAASAI